MEQRDVLEAGNLFTHLLTVCIPDIPLFSILHHLLVRLGRYLPCHVRNLLNFALPKITREVFARMSFLFPAATKLRRVVKSDIFKKDERCFLAFHWQAFLMDAEGPFCVSEPWWTRRYVIDSSSDDKLPPHHALAQGRPGHSCTRVILLRTEKPRLR